MSGSTDALLRPRSIAVIGEGRKRGSISAEVFHNLVHVGSQRAVYPVNTKAPRVQSMRSYASVEEIPDPVDLAVPARGYGMREAYLAMLIRRTELGCVGDMRGVRLQRMADKGIETFVGAAEAPQRVDDIRTPALLEGFCSGPMVGKRSLAEVLLRVGCLVADFPHMAEIDLNPVIARPDGVTAVDARIRVVT